MNKKDRTILACEEIAEKYRNPTGKRFFYNRDCPLCDIHYGGWGCKGCPLASRLAGMGCTDFHTFDKAESY